MIKTGMQVFVASDPTGESIERTLHPAALTGVRDGGYRLELIEPISAQAGDPLLVFFEDLLVFMQQRVVISQVATGMPQLLEVDALAEPASAETRTSLRIATHETALRATLNEESDCPVVDISQRGFAVRARSRFALGERVHALLHHGSEDLAGSVVVRSARELESGEWRYGMLCLDGVLRFALRGVNLTLQRQALHRKGPPRPVSPGHSDPSAKRNAPLPGAQGAPHSPQERPRLAIRFRSLLAFEQEFHSNIVRGGLFIPTTGRFERGETVQVALDLDFCAHELLLAAEVMSCSGPGLDKTGVAAGVAVRFLEAPERLRDLLCELTGLNNAPLPVAPLVPERSRRPHARTRTRIAAVLDVDGQSRTGHTRNVSRSGALIVVEGEPVPIGKGFAITLMDPVASSTVCVAARVVRHVQHEGRVTCIGICFAIDPGKESSVTRFLERIENSAHARQLGAIRGSVGTVGVASLIQMFGSSVDEGTLVLTRDAEEAHVLIEAGSLRHVSACGVTGLKGLARLLDWYDGDFEFNPTIAAGEPESIPIPVASALLECAYQADELRRKDREALPRHGTVQRVGNEPAAEETSDLERQILDKLTRKHCVQELLDAVPAYDAEILDAIRSLLSRRQIGIWL